MNATTWAGLNLFRGFLSIDLGAHGLHVAMNGRGVHVAWDRREAGEAVFWRSRDAAGTTMRLGPFLVMVDGRRAEIGI